MPLRLLLNAEPFGFGPSAAIAGFLPHLRPHFETVGFVGKKHALDLQKGLPYDALHDVTAMGRDERAETLAPVFAQYDVFMTAMDYKMAGLAKDAGLKVFYYDALAWYWPGIPKRVKKGDLYLAQDFFGVKERVSEAFKDAAAEPHVVPPIAPNAPQGAEKTHVLINLGGLQNPYWPVAGVVDYARAVITSLRAVMPAGENLVIAGSRAVAAELENEGVRTYSRREMEGVLAGAKAAFMTPGLGNIYDAAAFGLPTAWLPPANDSQGRQLDLLKQNAMQDGALDWAEIGAGKIDYRAEQGSVLEKIAAAATALAENGAVREKFSALAAARYAALPAASNTVKLLDRFGRDGEAKVAGLVVQKARQYVQKEVQHG